MNYLCNIFTKDREIAAAVNENGKAFYYVNESIKDEALALAAVTQNEMALLWNLQEIQNQAKYVLVSIKGLCHISIKLKIVCVWISSCKTFSNRIIKW